MVVLYVFSLTPTTNIGASADGAEMATLRLLTFLCTDAFSTVVKIPEDSTTKSAPRSPQGISDGSLLLLILIGFPFISRVDSSKTLMVPLKTP
nr:hypothetical protein CLUG_04411 [Ipomoea batatas]GMD42077.1 hypothetical protein CLUG_04411 [Ipomoea batatas]GMD51219.1 hypothetical protein CLUG_04411 [Ipomoea batatas]